MKKKYKELIVLSLFHRLLFGLRLGVGLVICNCLFFVISARAVTFDKCKPTDESCCIGVKVLIFNEKEDGTTERYVDLQNGESACTVVTWNDPDRESTGGTVLIRGKQVCENGKAHPVSGSYYDTCEDKVNSDGANIAELKMGITKKEVNYPDQNLYNKEIGCVPSNSNTTSLSFPDMCQDNKTIVRCMVDGKMIVINKCSGSAVCKMNLSFGVITGTTCVDPVCPAENGVSAANGESKCIPNSENDYSPKTIKKCFINEYQEIEKCQDGEQCVDNGGAATCMSSTVRACHGSDVNKPELGDLTPGSSTCAGSVMWDCGTDSKFKQGTDCSKTSKPYCYTRRVPDGNTGLNNKAEAYCDNRSVDELTDDEKKTILNLTVKRGTGFWCSEDENNLTIQTALGCLPITATGIVGVLLPMLFGIAGGISFLLMIYGFILVATSSGDEKKLMGARDTITSAITGLLVSIFAIFLFRLIAVNILKIPGL